MIGASPWVIPPSWHVHVIDFRDRLAPRGLLSREDLFEYDIEIRDLYHHIADALEHPKPPQLQNTDGDPLEMTTLTYELSVAPAKALERLRPLATLDGDTQIADETFDAAGRLASATLQWVKAGNRQMKEWDNTILGRLRLEGSRVVVDVNSARRRDRIAKEVTKRLGSAATLVDTVVTDIAAELQKRREAAGGLAAAKTADAADERSPELAAIEAELVHQHLEAWVDTKVPALGNRTPRQAAKSARGRERLEALLSDFSRSAERRPSLAVPDIAALRRTLGLE